MSSRGAACLPHRCGRQDAARPRFGDHGHCHLNGRPLRAFILGAVEAHPRRLPRPAAPGALPGSGGPCLNSCPCEDRAVLQPPCTLLLKVHSTLVFVPAREWPSPDGLPAAGATHLRPCPAWAGQPHPSTRNALQALFMCKTTPHSGPSPLHVCWSGSCIPFPFSPCVQSFRLTLILLPCASGHERWEDLDRTSPRGQQAHQLLNFIKHLSPAHPPRFLRSGGLRSTAPVPCRASTYFSPAQSPCIVTLPRTAFAPSFPPLA